MSRKILAVSGELNDSVEAGSQENAQLLGKHESSGVDDFLQDEKKHKSTTLVNRAKSGR